MSIMLNFTFILAKEYVNHCDMRMIYSNGKNLFHCITSREACIEITNIKI